MQSKNFAAIISELTTVVLIFKAEESINKNSLRGVKSPQKTVLHQKFFKFDISKKKPT